MGCTDSVVDFIPQHRVVGSGDGAQFVGQRGAMVVKVNTSEDFITHHIKNEKTLSQYVSSDRIRRRQIVSHFFMFSKQLDGDFGSSLDLLIKSWMQRVFLECIEAADTDFFKLNKSYDDTRKAIADKFAFETYMLSEFIAAASGFPLNGVQSEYLEYPVSIFILILECSLYPILKEVKKRYPQVADDPNVKFPTVKEVKKSANLLEYFPSACFKDPEFENVDTIFADLKFLFTKAMEDFESYQKDMKNLLGDDVLTDAKVKTIKREVDIRTRNANGEDVVIKKQFTEFNPTAVRRVMIKWAENLIDSNPKLKFTEAFGKFLRAKDIIGRNFFIASTESTPNINDYIIKVLAELIESCKYDPDTLAKNPLVFDIYDLLRCKTKRATGEEIVELINKMSALTKSQSGKRIEVMRVRDRLKTPNRDVMVNFRYGEYIVAEAQLCIDASHVDEIIKKKNKFNHYIYELERSLFGPTLELLMQYEDFNRKDITVGLYETGKVSLRKKNQNKKFKLRETKRKCGMGHDMMEGVGNNLYDGLSSYGCDICQTSQDFNKPYDYCPKCSVMFCRSKDCEAFSSSPEIKNLIPMVVDSPKVFTEITSKAQLLKYAADNSGCIVMFSMRNTAPCTISQDYITYAALSRKHISKGLTLGIVYNEGEGRKIAEEYQVKTFPTFHILQKTGNSRKMAIGASLEYIMDMFEWVKQLKSNKNPALPVKCKSNHNGDKVLRLVQYGQDQQWACTNCGPAETWGEVFGVAEDKTVSFKCPERNCHTNLCRGCAFLAYAEPGVQQGRRGRSYLCYTPKSFNPSQCRNGHQMLYTIQNPKGLIEYPCIGCDKNFVFVNEEGMSVCAQCDQYRCSDCIGIEKATMDERKNYDLIHNWSETTMSEGARCRGKISQPCGRFYKKTYATRKVKPKPEGSEDGGVMGFLSSLATPQWTCDGCRKETDEGILHIACFRCQIEICLTCASKAELLETKVYKQTPDTEIPLPFVCEKQHQMIRTNKPYQDELRFICDSCKVHFYPKTPHFRCYTCKLDICDDCCGKSPLAKYAGSDFVCYLNHKLVHMQMPPTCIPVICSKNQHNIMQPQSYWFCPICPDNNIFCNPNGECITGEELYKCPNGHPMTVNMEPALQFCNGCGTYISDPPAYHCAEDDTDYCLKCLKTRASNPMKGY